MVEKREKDRVEVKNQQLRSKLEDVTMSEQRDFTLAEQIVETFFTDGPRAARALIEVAGLNIESNRVGIDINLKSTAHKLISQDNRRFNLVTKVLGQHVQPDTWTLWLFAENHDKPLDSRPTSDHFFLHKYRWHIQ